MAVSAWCDSATDLTLVVLYRKCFGRNFRVDIAVAANVIQPSDDREEKMTPIKVLHVLEVEKEAFYFTNLIDFSDKDEVEFTFVNFAPECDFSKSIETRGLRVFSIGKFQKIKFARHLSELNAILKDIDPDIVHTHLFDPTTIGLWAAKRLNKKTVLTRHHSDAAHNIPSKLKRSFYLWLEKQNNARADHIIAPSKMVRECVVDREGTPAEKVSIIPYGQMSARFDAVTSDIIKQKRAELGMDKQLSLLCVSRLFHRKGHRYLLEAFAALIKNGLSAKLYLIGTGDFRQKLESMVDQFEIADQVEFLGWRDDGLQIIAAADIIVHPSLEDALSQSLIESLMLSKPIVATDISGASDTLDGGKYGKLVPPADAESLRAAVDETIQNLESAKETARLGKEYLLNYMNANRVADEYLKIYKRVLNK